MKFTKSIRWRLLLWIALFLALILGGLDFTAYQIHLSNRVNLLDEELRQHVATLSAALFAPGNPNNFGNHPPDLPGDNDRPAPPPGGFEDGPPPDDFGQPNRPPQNSPRAEHPPGDAARASAAARKFATPDANDFYFLVWPESSATPFVQSTNAVANVPRPQLTVKDTGTYTRTRETVREAFHATELGDCILVGRSLAPEISDARRFAGLLILGSGGFLLLVLGGAWFIIGHALQPVEKISAAARRIADGNLSERINTSETESELGQLAGVLNSTFARLETAFAQQKQFTADAAHELRTPIAVLISEAQTTLARERDGHDYREALTATLDTAQQMRRLTESLLELSRLDAGEEILHREKINLAAIAQDCIKLVSPLAAARNLQIHCDFAPAEISGDTEKLSRAVINLLTNAVRYNRDGGKILVTTRTENNSAILSAADTGQGISATDLPRIFERFYRADKSRSSGGNGLGLSICKAIIEAHGGMIEVFSEENVGTTFTVRLPI